ncbi:sulfonate ABC transporter [Sorangium cellulosum]|uniref:Sulfonate ABC transporter n=1 Tax=Sorangium cellulosum TaxID=56 RepID=A0A2L0ELV3_SORCE|nr:ABC transporter permease [Sorangium cellulosum]AUX40277.1 sulfonate ABC transporter [Sorangium cellulosum]
MTQQSIHESQAEAAAYQLVAPVPALPAGGAARLLPRRVGNIAVGLLFPAALFLAWRVAAERELVPPQILPAPGLVFQTLTELASSGDLHTNIAISLGRVFGGFAVGGAAGLVLGVAMGLSRRIEDYLHPLFRAVAQVPVLGWLPLLMMLVGIGESLKLIIIASASLVPVALNTLQGIRGVPRTYIEVARVFRLSHAAMLRKVVLPAAVPSIAVGIRYGLTQAWLSLVTVELLASSEGVGFLIVWGRQLFQLDVVLAAILVVGILGLALDKGIETIEARLLRWRRVSL